MVPCYDQAAGTAEKEGPEQLANGVKQGQDFAGAFGTERPCVLLPSGSTPFSRLLEACTPGASQEGYEDEDSGFRDCTHRQPLAEVSTVAWQHIVLVGVLVLSHGRRAQAFGEGICSYERWLAG